LAAGALTIAKSPPTSLALAFDIFQSPEKTESSTAFLVLLADAVFNRLGLSCLREFSWTDRAKTNNAAILLPASLVEPALGRAVRVQKVAVYLFLTAWLAANYWLSSISDPI
jgi:hypothetical protein